MRRLRLHADELRWFQPGSSPAPVAVPRTGPAAAPVPEDTPGGGARPALRDPGGAPVKPHARGAPDGGDERREAGARLRRERRERRRRRGERRGHPRPGAEPKGEEMDFSKEFEILGKIDDDWRDYMANAGGTSSFSAEDAERRQHFFDSVATETSLQEHLMRQAEMTDLSEKAMLAMVHLVGSLDDRGFLTAKAADVALQTALPLESVQEAVAALKGFDPRGSARRAWPSASWRSWSQRAGATPSPRGSSGTTSTS